MRKLVSSVPSRSCASSFWTISEKVTNGVCSRRTYAGPCGGCTTPFMVVVVTPLMVVLLMLLTPFTGGLWLMIRRKHFQVTLSYIHLRLYNAVYGRGHARAC